MLSITRAVARVLRATLRKAGDVQSRAKPTVLSFRADDHGLRIQSRAGSVGVEYRMEGTFPAESFRLPFAALADFEGTAATFVTFAAEPNGSVRVEWTDSGVPQRRLYAAQATHGWKRPRRCGKSATARSSSGSTRRCRPPRRARFVTP